MITTHRLAVQARWKSVLTSLGNCSQTLWSPSSDPSWESHALFGSRRFPVQNYRYYDAASHDVNRAGMLEDLNALLAA